MQSPLAIQPAHTRKTLKPATASISQPLPMRLSKKADLPQAHFISPWWLKSQTKPPAWYGRPSLFPATRSPLHPHFPPCALPAHQTCQQCQQTWSTDMVSRVPGTAYACRFDGSLGFVDYLRRHLRVRVSTTITMMITGDDLSSCDDFQVPISCWR